MPCAKCTAMILPNDETAEHGAMHLDCHTKWIAELYAELEGTRVPAKAAKGGLK